MSYTCPKCHRILTLTSKYFYKDKKNKETGFNKICKKCYEKYSRKRKIYQEIVYLGKIKPAENFNREHKAGPIIHIPVSEYNKYKK